MVFFGPCIFFIISNLGEWIHSSYYAKDISGLIECFYLAIPFFKNTLISTIFYCLFIIFVKKFFLNFKKNLNAKFFNSSKFIKKTDYIFASGIFNIKLDETYENWKKTKK